jgi:hypothetical protein
MVARVGDIQIAGAVDGHVGRIAETVRAESIGIASGEAVVAVHWQRVGLADDDIRGLIVGEAGRVNPSEHAIVDWVGDVQMIRCGAGIDGDSLGQLQRRRGRIVDSVVSQIHLSEHQCSHRWRWLRSRVLEDAVVGRVGDEDVARAVERNAVGLA